MKLRLMPAKPGRLLVLVLGLVLVLAGTWAYRRWHLTVTLTTEHFS